MLLFNKMTKCKKTGTKDQVYCGKALQTKKGEKKKDLIKNKDGKIVNRKRSLASQRAHARQLEKSCTKLSRAREGIRSTEQAAAGCLPKGSPCERCGGTRKSAVLPRGWQFVQKPKQTMSDQCMCTSCIERRRRGLDIIYDTRQC